MHRVEGDVIHGVYKSLIFCVRSRVASMALEREIASKTLLDTGLEAANKFGLTVNPSPQHISIQL